MSYFRENIDNMEGYIPGKQPKDGVYIKLNTNENPYPVSPKVLDGMRSAVNENLRLYPDPFATPAREKIAALLGFKVENIIVGNGSDDVLTMIIRSFVGKGDKAVVPFPTYSLYKTLIELQEGECCKVNFSEDYSLPLNEVVIKDARVTFLSNPNSPSGTFIEPEEVSKIANAVDGVLVVDEAYVDFASVNCLSLVNKHPNIIILRTLSKSYSLAGLRLGFGIAQEDLISGMLKVKDSYNVDRLGIAGVIAALDDQDHMKCNVEKIKKTRTFLSNELTKLNFSVYPSQSNFVFAKSPNGVNTKELFSDLNKRKILVRYFDEPGTNDCLRITIGTDTEIKTLLDNISEILNDYQSR